MTNVAPPPAKTCANVAGPLQVWVGTGSASVLEFLGWTINGASITETPFISPLASDQYGGDQGPPADYQFFGGQHQIRLEMLEYVATVLAKLEYFYNAAALATATGTASVGMLLGCTPLTTRVLLLAGTAAAPTYVRNYTATQIIEPIEQEPIGSQATRVRLSFIANYGPGASPYDAVVTA